MLPSNFMQSLLQQHKTSDGNFIALARNLQGHYARIKKQSILSGAEPQNMLTHEKSVWLSFEKNLRESAVASILHLITCYLGFGIEPTQEDDMGKYNAVEFLTGLLRFIDITRGMENSYWK